MVSSAGSQDGSPTDPSAFLSAQDPLNPDRARPCALGSGSTGHGLDDPDGDLLEEDAFEEAPAPGGAPDEPGKLLLSNSIMWELEPVGGSGSNF